MRSKLILFFLLFCTLLFTVSAEVIPVGDAVPSAIVSKAGGYPRSKTYAETTNPLDEVHYEFMLTADGQVIYKKEGDVWRYFGDGMGYNLDSVHHPEEQIGPFDMIAADGNRVMVKKANSNLFYFASILNGGIELTKGDGTDLVYDPANAHRSFFITSAPKGTGNSDGYDMKKAYDNYALNNILSTANKGSVPPIMAEIALLLPLSAQIARDVRDGEYGEVKFVLEAFEFNTAVTIPLVPYSWPVVVEPRHWYRIKGTNMDNKEISDIGVFDIHKITAARVKRTSGSEGVSEFYKKFGSEYRRPYGQPIEINLFFGLLDIKEDPAHNKYLIDQERAYCAFVDGTANYYIMTAESNNEYKVWNIDEQSYFCSQWHYWSRMLEIELSPFVNSLSDNALNWQPENWESREIWSAGTTALAARNANAYHPHPPDYVPYGATRKYKDNLDAWWAVDGQNKNYLDIKWREVGSIDNPWVWTAQECVSNPKTGWDWITVLTKGDNDSHIIVKPVPTPVEYVTLTNTLNLTVPQIELDTIDTLTPVATPISSNNLGIENVTLTATLNLTLDVDPSMLTDISTTGSSIQYDISMIDENWGNENIIIDPNEFETSYEGLIEVSDGEMKLPTKIVATRYFTFTVGDHLIPFFDDSGYWDIEAGTPFETNIGLNLEAPNSYYPLKQPFSTTWADQKLIFENEPSLDVSMENIVVSDGNQVYSICWGWGSMDFSWRKRNLPKDTLNNDVFITQDMEIYVPAVVNGKWGYYSQTLLPPSYLNDADQDPSYIYPAGVQASMPHQDSWTFKTLDQLGLTNAEFEFRHEITKQIMPVLLSNILY